MSCPTDYCPRNQDEATASCPQPDDCPQPACKCAFNHRRAENGTCIDARQCPPFKCPDRNQEFVHCPPICPDDVCSQATPDGSCPLIMASAMILECTPKCRCRKNYWRNNRGVCVPYSRCIRERDLNSDV
ncbi:hypothetical protein ACJJTC_000452 [Scirpophaga incertulas]